MAGELTFPRTITEFERMFATEADCARYLAGLRWPKGYACPRCSHKKAWMTARQLLVCSKCRHHLNITAGTLFFGTHYPLKTWFRVAWHVCEQKSGISALGLKRALGFGSYHTAWEWLQRMRRAMVLPGRNKLTGEVEVDEAFLGGVKSGKRGRGAAGKVLILVATEVRTLPPAKPPTNPKRKPRKVKTIRAIGRIRLLVIPNATGATLEQGVTDLVELGSNVVTDGLASYNGLQTAGFNHTVSKTGANVGIDLLPKCHRVISPLKRWILGTHQGSMDPGFTQFYLDEFVFRFNRRSSKSRGSIFRRLLEQAAVHPPITKQSLSP